jgi:hypothetical protein
MTKFSMSWNSGNPLKKGAYPVRSGGPSPNSGWRYWNGDSWSNLRHTYRDAVNLGKGKCISRNRNTPLQYPVLWGVKIRNE